MKTIERLQITEDYYIQLKELLKYFNRQLGNKRLNSYERRLKTIIDFLDLILY